MTKRHSPIAISKIFEKDIRIAEIHNNIRNREEKIFDLKNNIATVEILEQEVETRDGEHLVIFNIKDSAHDGIAVAMNDIQSGKITREPVYKELAGVDA